MPIRKKRMKPLEMYPDNTSVKRTTPQDSANAYMNASYRNRLFHPEVSARQAREAGEIEGKSKLLI